MRGLAKQSIHTMYTEAQLVSFGNYLLKTYGVQVFSNEGQNVPLYQREVTDADYCNWSAGEIVGNPQCKLPSQFQEGDAARFMIKPEGSEELFFCPSHVLAVHFYPRKVKYDIELHLADNTNTRLYNIDSCFVVPHP